MGSSMRVHCSGTGGSSLWFRPTTTFETRRSCRGANWWPSTIRERCRPRPPARLLRFPLCQAPKPRREPSARALPVVLRRSLGLGPQPGSLRWCSGQPGGIRVASGRLGAEARLGWGARNAIGMWTRAMGGQCPPSNPAARPWISPGCVSGDRRWDTMGDALLNERIQATVARGRAGKS